MSFDVRLGWWWWWRQRGEVVMVVRCMGQCKTDLIDEEAHLAAVAIVGLQQCRSCFHCVRPLVRLRHRLPQLSHLRL